MTTYTTKLGDMWDSIAYTQLGSTRYTGDLMRCNGKYLDYFRFPAGIVLNVPEGEDIAETETVASVPWR